MIEKLDGMKRSAAIALCGVALAPSPAYAEQVQHPGTQTVPASIDHASPKNPNTIRISDEKDATLRVIGGLMLFASTLTIALLSDRDKIMPFDRHHNPANERS